MTRYAAVERAYRRLAWGFTRGLRQLARWSRDRPAARSGEDRLHPGAANGIWDCAAVGTHSGFFLGAAMTKSVRDVGSLLSRTIRAPDGRGAVPA